MSKKSHKQMLLAQQYARAGAPAEARQILRRIVAADQADIAAWFLLGQVAGTLGAHDEAEQAFAQAARLDPGRAEAQLNLGIARRQQGKHEAALTALRATLAVAPRSVPALVNIVGVLHELDRQREALPYLETWLAIEPRNASAHYTAAVVQQALEQLQAAREHYEAALALGASGFSAYSTHLNLGVVCHRLRDFVAAAEHCRQALVIRPDCAVSRCNLGNALKEQGRYAEAIASFARAVELAPDYADAHSNILFCMNFSPDYTPQQTFEAHVEWGRRHGCFPRATSAPRDRDPRRRLRVGYVSADFREHPVGFFLAGVLRHHATDDFDIHCYFNSAQADAMTAALRAQAGHWRPIAGLADDAVATLVGADGIDILVDLSGHTAGNRLPVFARKPAPIQVTWLGYCNTTGLNSVDYLLADANVIPIDSPQRFCEEVVRLPGSYLCYQAPDYAPAVVAPPCLADGAVTFGCFNNLPKVTEPMLALWAGILGRLPTARLVLKAKQLADPTVCRRLGDFFADHGVDLRRLRLDGSHLDHASLLAYYGRIDIALDTHPYSGVTTTCEALWMGVPIVTLAGEQFISRNSAGMLANVGLSELIAGTPADYVDIAVALAGDHTRLAELRRAQRERFLASTLGDAAQFTRHLETAYRGMWEKYCATAP